MTGEPIPTVLEERIKSAGVDLGAKGAVTPPPPLPFLFYISLCVLISGTMHHYQHK